ncbi:calcium-binding protein [Microvirga splendida]|nr:calcium-binding protein [Microvirga splendida]
MIVELYRLAKQLGSIHIEAGAMQYLNWTGTFIVDSWADVGSPGDRPIKSMGGQVWGINNIAAWGDGLDVYTLFGTSDIDLIFLDKTGFDTPRLTNVTRINVGAGNDLVDLTSTRFNYGATTISGGTGNDWLLGNSGRDRLLGGSGRDQLKGYGGNDYISGGNGNDHLHGGRGNDKLIGGSGHDYLMGQVGKDTLTGGGGSDRFVFDVSPTSSNRDTITDFSVRYDSIHLDKSVFTKAGLKGGLKAKAFWTGSAAHDRDDRVIYNDETGYLYYDPDGTGGASQKMVAKLSKDLAITHKDFFIV